MRTSSFVIESTCSLNASNAALERRSGCLSITPAAAPRLALSDLTFTSNMASIASAMLDALMAEICGSRSGSYEAPDFLFCFATFLPGVLRSLLQSV